MQLSAIQVKKQSNAKDPATITLTLQSTANKCCGPICPGLLVHLCICKQDNSEKL